MGIEYVATLPSGREALDLPALFAQVRARAEWVVCGHQTPTRLVLRYADLPERPRWPEDIVIEGVGEGLSVLFHSGTGAQRRRLLGLLEEACLAQGVATSFEEV